MVTLKSLESKLSASLKKASMRLAFNDVVNINYGNDQVKLAISAIAYGHLTGRYDGTISTYFLSLTARDFLKLVVIPVAKGIEKLGIDNQYDAFDYTRQYYKTWSELGLASLTANR